MKNWKNNMRGLRVSKIVENQIYALFASHTIVFERGSKYFSFIGKESALWEFTDSNFLLAENAVLSFLESYEQAKRCENGFYSIRRQNATLYVRHKGKGEYQFIVEKDGAVFYYQDRAEYFLDTFDFYALEITRGYEERRAALKDEEHYLYQEAIKKGDAYLVCLIKDIRKRATKEDVLYLNETDGKHRFFVDKDIYGQEDIILVGDLKLLPKSFFSRSTRYGSSMRFENREYPIVWYPSSPKKLSIGNAYVSITDELKEKILINIEQGKNRFRKEVLEFVENINEKTDIREISKVGKTKEETRFILDEFQKRKQKLERDK